MHEVPQFTDIHFPRQIGLIKKLRYISFIMNDVTLLLSFLSLFVWATNFLDMNALLFQRLALAPFTPLLFIFSSIPLLFGAKRHLINTHYDAEKEERLWWIFGVPILFAAAVAVLGFINFIHLTDLGILSIFHTSSYTGFCFFLLGLALIPPYTSITYRFHITQFLIFIVNGLNVFVILESTYQLFSPLPAQQIAHVSLLAALSFVFFCFGILIRWSNRGFFGNFTLDSTASIFALRVFIINFISAPVFALIVFFFMQNTAYNVYQVLTIVVVGLSFISSILLWINVKLLYSHELEHLLMRESLRAHNVDLTKEEEELRKRMDQLEIEKKQYLDKLKSQDSWEDAVDRLG